MFGTVLLIEPVADFFFKLFLLGYRVVRLEDHARACVEVASCAGQAAAAWRLKGLVPVSVYLVAFRSGAHITRTQVGGLSVLAWRAALGVHDAMSRSPCPLQGGFRPQQASKKVRLCQLLLQSWKRAATCVECSARRGGALGDPWAV